MEVVETHRPSWSRGATPLGLDTVPTMEPLPFFTIHLCSTWASLVAQLVKNLPAMQETLGSIPGMGRAAGEGIDYPLQYSWATLVTQLVKNLPAVWEAWVQYLGWEDPLEKGTATHSKN